MEIGIGSPVGWERRLYPTSRNRGLALLRLLLYWEFDEDLGVYGRLLRYLHLTRVDFRTFHPFLP